MLDWMFMLLFILAFLFIIFCLKTEEEEPYWKILFITVSIVLWFILALSNLNIETPYQMYNATTGTTTLEYSQYIDEGNTYLSYFFMLMGILCFIYLFILIFDIYYKYIEGKENQFEEELNKE